MVVVVVVIGCRLLVIGCWLLGIIIFGWLLVVGCWLSVVGGRWWRLLWLWLW